MTLQTDELQDRLHYLIEKFHVPGAALAVSQDGEITEAAAGIANMNTGIEVTTDTLFQIGSITKVYTATLLMQLVDEGLVGLDEPVVTYLPELRFADERATRAVTVRQLLSHSSGVEGDHFEDFGRGDDAIERYVESCAHLPQLHPPGEMFSYCNSGFVVAGQLLERLTGKPFSKVLRERLMDPLGLHYSANSAEEAILHRAAVGHVRDPKSGATKATQVWALATATAPAGSQLCSTPAEVIAFARMHFNDGRAENGTVVLSRDGIHAMQQAQVVVPAVLGSDAWGLGWAVKRDGERRIIGHDGGTLGQMSFLRLVPEARFAVCLLTNGYGGASVSEQLLGELFRTRVGIPLPESPQAAASQERSDLARMCGTYERLNVRVQIELEGESLVLSIKASGVLEALHPTLERVPLRVVNENAFLLREPRTGKDAPIAFHDFDEDGAPRYLYLGTRAARRTA